MNRCLLILLFLALSSCKVSYKESASISTPGNQTTSGIYLNAKVCLEGAFTGATPLLSNSLSLLLPGVFESSWVDWVDVELFKKTGAVYTLVYTKSALLDQSGLMFQSIEYTMNFEQGLFFSGLSAGEYYINIRSRNHLSIGALQPITLGESLNPALDIDFTLPTTYYLGETGISATEPFVLENSGTVKCLAAGDVNQDYTIDSDDLDSIDDFIETSLLSFNVIFNNNLNAKVSGYYPEDVNFSGDVQAYADLLGSSIVGTDREIVSGNLNRSSQVYPIP